MTSAHQVQFDRKLRALMLLSKEQLRNAITELGGFWCTDDSKTLLAECLWRSSPRVEIVLHTKDSK